MAQGVYGDWLLGARSGDSSLPRPGPPAGLGTGPATPYGHTQRRKLVALAAEKLSTASGAANGSLTCVHLQTTRWLREVFSGCLKFDGFNSPTYAGQLLVPRFLSNALPGNVLLRDRVAVASKAES
jgi:hypothetical protein